MQHLDAIHGNQAAVHYLQHMIKEGRVHHTLLFYGPEGVGKTTCARAFAHELGIRPSDIREFHPEGKAYIHTMESMAEVRKAASEHPYESQKKLLLIREADRMLPSGANALLKTLEEPLGTTVLILTTSNVDLILETIQSRACLVAFRALSKEELEAALIDKGVDADKIRKAVSLAQGSISRALEYENEEKIEGSVFAALSRFVQGDISSCFDHLSEVEEENPEHVFDIVLQWFRDIHLIRAGASEDLLYNKEQSEALKQLAIQPVPELDHVVRSVHKGYTSIKHNMRLKPVLEGILCSLIPNNSLVTRD